MSVVQKNTTLADQGAACDLLSNTGMAAVAACAFSGILVEPLLKQGHSVDPGLLHLSGTGTHKEAVLHAVAALRATPVQEWSTAEERGLEEYLLKTKASALLLSDLDALSEHASVNGMLYTALGGIRRPRDSATVKVYWSPSIISEGEISFYDAPDLNPILAGHTGNVLDCAYQPEVMWDSFMQSPDSNQISDRIDSVISELRDQDGYTLSAFKCYIQQNTPAIANHFKLVLDELRERDIPNPIVPRRDRFIALVITSAHVLSVVLQDSAIRDRVHQFFIERFV